jgi:hypothetical protein
VSPSLWSRLHVVRPTADLTRPGADPATEQLVALFGPAQAASAPAVVRIPDADRLVPSPDVHRT